MKKLRGICLLLSVVFLCVSVLSSCASVDASAYVAHSLSVTDDGTFKILMLTDLHFIDSQVTSRQVKEDLSLRDGWAMTAVETVVREADPDMIVVTGDIVFTQSLVEFITGNDDNYETFRKAADFIDGFGIPWAFTFGNHDEEGSLLEELDGDKDRVKKILGDYLTSENIKNCLFTAGPEEINGCGNYLINVLNRNGSVNTSLVFFDSGSYIKTYNESTGEMEGGVWNYEYVHDDQLDWYETAIKQISAAEKHTVPSMVFQHIPLPIYKTVLDAYLKALEANGEAWRDTVNYEWEYGKERTLETEIGKVTYHGGVCNKEKQEVAHSFIGEFNGVRYDGGNEFKRISDLGSTKYIFCGHDHRNTFSFTYQGVRLTYGMSIDYSAVGLLPSWMYPNQNIYDETEQRGGTLITIKEDGDPTIAQIPFARNLYQEAIAERKASA